MMNSDDSPVPRTPLLAPTAYFERRDRPSLRLAAAIMLGEVIGIGIVVWLFVQRVLANVDFGGVDAGDVRAELIEQVFLLVILTFVGWLFLGGILHTFMWFASGDRAFPSTLAVVGETEWVAVVLLPLTGGVMLWVAGGTPSTPRAAIEYIREVTSNGLLPLLVLGMVGTVWRAIVSGVGLAVVHNVPRGKAYAATFIVGIVGFLIGLGSG